MKLAIEPRTIQSHGIAGEKEYKIKLGAHTMMLLSDLYSDPIWAIVREYATNMLDGYTKLRALNPSAKIITPEIHLPNTLEPFVTFKDYGIGMSFETVWEVFTSYGESTKNDNDEEVGGLGIGSKVAFAYRGADQWIIESRYNGLRMIFNALKNANGIPTLQHIESVPTTEPNGVTIQIPVARQDISNFRKATERLMAYFPMDVSVIGNADYKKPPLEYMMRGSNWGLKQGNGTSQVIMGNIPYPLELNQLPAVGGALKFLKDNQYYVHADIFLPVGSAQFVPSREALLYSERTKNAIVDALGSFVDELKTKAEADVQSAPTKWEAIQALYNAYSIPGMRNYVSAVKWRGQEISVVGGIKIDMAELVKEFPDLTVERYDNNGGKANFGRSVIPNDLYDNLKPDSKQWVFLDDTGKHNGPVRRVRKMLLDTFTRQQSWSRRRTVTGSGEAFVFKAAGLTRARLVEILGGFPVEYVTTLPEPVYARSGGPRKRTSVKLFDWSDPSNWVDADVDVEDGGYFIRLEGGSPMGTSDYTIHTYLSLGKKAGILPDDFEVYGIPRSRSNIESKDGWVDFLEWFRPQAVAHIKEHAKDYHEVAAWEDLSPNVLVMFADDDEVIDAVRKVKPRSPLIKLHEAIQAIKQKEEKVGHLDELARSLSVEIPVHATKTNPEALITHVKNKHPNLVFIAELADLGYGSAVDKMKEHLPRILNLL